MRVGTSDSGQARKPVAHLMTAFGSSSRQEARPGMTTEFQAHLRIPAARFRVRVLEFGVPLQAEGAGSTGRSTAPAILVG
jgi:hypothetical protein